MTENKMNKQICFYPHIDVEAVFKKAKTIKKGQPNELELLRDFYYSMKFYYDFSNIQDSDADATGENLIVLYEYAKRGVGGNPPIKKK